MEHSQRILVTGATGYVGGRLVLRLLDLRRPLRVLVRDPARLDGRPWAHRVHVVRGDVLRPETLPAAVEGVHTAYYLIHGMLSDRGDPGDFGERDLAAAENFATAARAAGVARIVYLGALGDPAADLSLHLRSRQQTGERLRAAGVPVTEFRAAVIVGSGSASFEMIRHLTEWIPFMPVPRSILSRVQPIAVRNVIDYLVAALDTPESAGRTIEIGGKDVLTYRDLVRGYARVRGLRRWIVPLPLLPMRLFHHWVYWVTPVPMSLARPLIEGLRNEVVVRDDTAGRLFPDVRPMNYETALRRALANLESGRVATAWSDALGSSQGDVGPVLLASVHGVIVDRRVREARAPAETLYRVFAGLGGARGWPYLNWVWRLRGVIDRIAGGPGFRRGRRDPDVLRVGDALDFLRVEAVEPGRMVRLRAEMKAPGGAWLEFEAIPAGDGRAQLVQTAYFAPKGLAGRLYWYLLYPIHALVFAGTVKRIARRASRWGRPVGARPGEPGAGQSGAGQSGAGQSGAGQSGAGQPATPPAPTGGLLGDLGAFLLRRPRIPTLVQAATEVEREDYSRRIMQRLGIRVDQYAVLNIHKIGINAPPHHVFEETLAWDGASTCWPNHLASVKRIDGRLENIRILLLGRERYPFGARKSFLGIAFIPLFNLTAIRIQRRPEPADFDSARYLLYECSGGYPIGVFTMYVRTSVAGLGEAEQTQFFFMVGFNFYGRDRWRGRHLVGRAWEAVHNRVTANILNRFKQLCEWRFAGIQEGRFVAADAESDPSP